MSLKKDQDGAHSTHTSGSEDRIYRESVKMSKLQCSATSEHSEAGASETYNAAETYIGTILLAIQLIRVYLHYKHKELFNA